MWNQENRGNNKIQLKEGSNIDSSQQPKTEY